MNVSLWCSRVIRWMFYLLFILVPLVLTPWNYELFEYNKMMITYALTALIAGTWVIKMVSDREIRIARTPLDIPIALFVVSQLVSTLFSMDPHVSWFGYYSRFNGGMLSVVSYVILFYAFVTNVKPETHQKEQESSLHTLLPFLRVMVVSGAVVALYGVAERLGIDKNLWVQDVQNRVFSTLGQPNWLAAYLVALLPLSMIFTIRHLPVTPSGKLVPPLQLSKHMVWLGSTILFFIVLLFTRSRSGLFGFAVSDAVLWSLIFLTSPKKKQLVPLVAILHGVFAVIIFFNGANIPQIDKYVSLQGIKNAMSQRTAAPESPKPSGYSAPILEAGGTESGVIRKYVWQGAITAWQNSTKAMLIGTGTETFAFAFYRFRPAGHNLTSEWDFLYNKAHNEYLNYLATTGLFGLGSYLLFIGTFVIWFVSRIKYHVSSKNMTPDTMTLSLALFAGWVSILVTNFFGFSVVIVQIFLFLFPALIYALHAASEHTMYTRKLQLPVSSSVASALIATIMAVLIAVLISSWYADTAYATSYRLARSGQFAQAREHIEQAVFLNPNEPVYHDELSTILAALANGAFEQQNATAGAQLAKSALAESDRAISTSPQNVNFWKTRTKLYYSFSSFDPAFNAAAITALEKALDLSPNDAKIYYNLAILSGRAGKNDASIELLKKAISLKPDYHDAYYALYVFYLEIKKPDLARAILVEYLQKIDPADQNFTEILGKTKQ